MGDWFDFNNDGKLDFFEETCKWDHIQRSVNQLNENLENKSGNYNSSNSYNSYNANNDKESSRVWDTICFIVGLVFVIAVIVFLGYLINLF